MISLRILFACRRRHKGAPVAAVTSLALVEDSETQVTASWDAYVGADSLEIEWFIGGVSQGVDALLASDTSESLAVSLGDQILVRVRAVVGAQRSAWRTATRQVKDVTLPSTISDLQATGGANRIDLTWTPATDNVAVTGYDLFRDGSFYLFISGGAADSYSDTGLGSEESHSYAIRARDADGNAAPLSNSDSATTSDTQAPAQITDLGVTQNVQSQPVLVWSDPPDEDLVGVRVYRDNTLLDTVLPGVENYTDTTAIIGEIHDYDVRGIDEVPNEAPASNLITCLVTDTTSPAAIDDLQGVPGNGIIELFFTEVSDNVGIDHYKVVLGGNELAGQVNPGDAQPVTIGGLTNGQAYSIFMRAYDAAGNTSDSNEVFVTPADNNQAPTIQSALPDISGVVGDPDVVISLDDYFADDAGDAALTYSLLGTTTACALSGTRGETLTVSRLAAVSGTRLVQATDTGGLTVTQSFNLSVAGDSLIEPVYRVRVPTTGGDVADHEVLTTDLVLLLDAASITEGDTVTFTMEADAGATITAVELWVNGVVKIFTGGAGTGWTYGWQPQEDPQPYQVLCKYTVAGIQHDSNLVELTVGA